MKVEGTFVCLYANTSRTGTGILLAMNAPADQQSPIVAANVSLQLVGQNSFLVDKKYKVTIEEILE
jgi:hypothetical protein